MKFIKPTGFYDALILECFNLDTNSTVTNYCNKSDECQCNSLLAGSFIKYRIRTRKDGFSDSSTDFYYLQTSKLYLLQLANISIKLLMNAI